MIALPPAPLRPRRPRLVRAVVVVLVALLVPHVVSALCTLSAVKGTVRGDVHTTDVPLRVDPPPTLLESAFGDIGALNNGDDVYVRCRNHDLQYGEYTLVRRPPLFRTRRADVTVTEPVPDC